MRPPTGGRHVTAAAEPAEPRAAVPAARLLVGRPLDRPLRGPQPLADLVPAVGGRQPLDGRGDLRLQIGRGGQPVLGQDRGPVAQQGGAPVPVAGRLGGQDLAEQRGEPVPGGLPAGLLDRPGQPHPQVLRHLDRPRGGRQLGGHAVQRRQVGRPERRLGPRPQLAEADASRAATASAQHGLFGSRASSARADSSRSRAGLPARARSR
jgi:hypothetical protein